MKGGEHMNRFILWFIRLIQKDCAEYEPDSKTKRKIYQLIKSQEIRNYRGRK